MSLLPSPLTVLDSVYDGAVKSVKYTNGEPMTRAREMRLLQELRESIDIARFASVFDGKFNPSLWVWYDVTVIPTRREENNGRVVYALQYPDKRTVKTVDPDKDRKTYYKNEVKTLIVTDSEVVMPISRVGDKVMRWDSHEDSNEWEDEHGFRHTSGAVTVYDPVWRYMGVVVILDRNDAVNAALTDLDQRIKEADEGNIERAKRVER
jgi:hypothetical protein